MKKLFYILGVLAISLMGCEDVIDVDLPESEPRLVIDAAIFRNVETEETILRVILSQTTPFFDEQIRFVNDAEVRITSSNDETFLLEAIGEGEYTNPNIVVESDVYYTLEVTFEGETYSATETIETVVPLEFVDQDDEGGFDNESIELKAYFTDPANVENFYFFEGLSERGNSYDALEDEFFDGNPIFGFYFVDDLEAEDEVTFRLSGIDVQYYDYLFTLLQQTGDQSGGPFEVQPATVRGNIVNQTDPDNYPLGYFRISEVSILTYTVQ
ncbi:DUF4249 domain-containing protein [Luteirhabdus pelagi]|jgi:hypothetical protein|uniref:DUF4249 domain-containing protein n=1 Tax=Luteirhabdus pelagi TaxID=2792783 RepID=UPI001939EFE5|nr:DUF4249 domain-containing protein [Luteirhabdus pelagi]